jgi:ADP-ribose pyrophosphatase YjhB (NUDIX family)
MSHRQRLVLASGKKIRISRKVNSNKDNIVVPVVQPHRNSVTEYQYPITTVDIAVFAVRNGRLSVLLSRRANTPFKGLFALPGGYVHVNEDNDLFETAQRVLKQKANLTAPYMEQLYSFSGRLRDARGWSVSVVYYAVMSDETIDMSDDIKLFPVDDLPALPFDHRAIIDKAVERLRGKASYSSLPMFLLPEEFTFKELQTAYEHVMGIEIDKVTFRRRIEVQDMIVPILGKTRGGANRPAQLFRRKGDLLHEMDQAF